MITSTIRGALDLYVSSDQALQAVSLADAITVADSAVDALNCVPVIEFGATLSLHDVYDTFGAAEDSAAEDSAARDGAASAEWFGDPVPGWLLGPSVEQRRMVLVAIGITMTTLDVPAVDALAVLRGFAYRTDAVVDDVASALVRGELDVTQLH